MVVVKLHGTGKYGYKKINPEAGLIFYISSCILCAYSLPTRAADVTSEVMDGEPL